MLTPGPSVLDAGNTARGRHSCWLGGAHGLSFSCVHRNSSPLCLCALNPECSGGLVKKAHAPEERREGWLCVWVGEAPGGSPALWSSPSRAVALVHTCDCSVHLPVTSQQVPKITSAATVGSTQSPSSTAEEGVQRLGDGKGREAEPNQVFPWRSKGGVFKRLMNP